LFVFEDLVSRPGGSIPDSGEKFSRRVLNLRTKNIYIVYSPKVVYVISFVAMLVLIVFTSLAAPRWCHLVKIKCDKWPLLALVMG
jgi:hypothetical protein